MRVRWEEVDCGESCGVGRKAGRSWLALLGRREEEFPVEH